MRSSPKPPQLHASIINALKVAASRLLRDGASLALSLAVLFILGVPVAAGADDGCIVDPMTSPISMRSLRNSGGRVFWSPSGNELGFIEEGEAYVLDMQSGGERCLSCGYSHAGFERVQFLGDGSVLLIGPANAAEASLDDSINVLGRFSGTSLWWMPVDASRAPQALAQRVFEGVAMAPDSNLIAWSESLLQLDLNDPSLQFELWTARVEVRDGVATLVDRNRVLSTLSIIEAQDILDGGQRLLYTSYYDLSRRFLPYDDPDGEVMTIEVATGEITNHTNNPAYDEAEAIFHGLNIDVIESGRDTGQGFGGQLDLYALELDGVGENIRRLTFIADQTPEFKANNPDVHPNGRSMAFSLGQVTGEASEATGADAGLILLEFGCAPAEQGSSDARSGVAAGALTPVGLLVLAVLLGFRWRRRYHGVACGQEETRRSTQHLALAPTVKRCSDTPRTI